MGVREIVTKSQQEAVSEFSVRMIIINLTNKVNINVTKKNEIVFLYILNGFMEKR
jgi:hypothetical protein